MVLSRALAKPHFFPPPLRHFLLSRSYSDVPKPAPPQAQDHRASSKLFADAAKEESAELEEQVSKRPSKLTQLESQHENWDGEERIQDAVLRMLVDKYKPLRSGTIRTADEKMKQTPPRVTSGRASSPHVDDSTDFSPTLDAVAHERDASNVSVPPWGTSRSSQDMASVPLLPAIEGHQPWHTTFRAPSHATSSVKYGHIPPPAPRRAIPLNAMDEKALRKEREQRKRAETAGRLSGAKESALDYRLGLKSRVGMQRRPNPATLKGWASLVEERIEKARQEGHFRALKGRGQPMVSVTDEKNPFIGREEFLMNRIVQRNGAAPPWVEIQGELESAVISFRELIKQSWTRRALRMLTLSQPPGLLPKLSLAQVTALRDAEWEARERAYHDSAVDDLNALVRKYNGLAPYAVRRPYYTRTAELEKAYKDSGEDILRGIAEMASTRGGPALSMKPGSADPDSESGWGSRGSASDEGWVPLRLRHFVRRWLSSFTGSSRT